MQSSSPRIRVQKAGLELRDYGLITSLRRRKYTKEGLWPGEISEQSAVGLTCWERVAGSQGMDSPVDNTEARD